VVINRLTVAVAVAGWALYGFSILGPQTPEAYTEAEIARLSQAAETANASRDALAAELGRFKEEHQDLQHIQKQIAAASQELKHLEYLRGRVSGEIDTMRPQPSRATYQAAPTAAASEPPAVGSLPLSKEEISKAQQALTTLGYGTLKADGVFGPGTRRAIEGFERAQGLPATGQLGAETLRAIKESSTSARP
jgi:murein L,D-transpeptidase YcbB/YkuD